MEESKKKSDLDNHNEDRSNWILGIFYFNPKDKRIFPPKRIGAFGWTVNFANPYSIAVCALLTAVVIFIFN